LEKASKNLHLFFSDFYLRKSGGMPFVAAALMRLSATSKYQFA